MIQTFTTRSEAETSDVGRRLAPTLSAGSVVLLIGDLGAGKTAFVRGLAQGLGLSPSDVTSPTFTLIQEYRGKIPMLLHVDLYRLTDSREIEDLGLWDLGNEAVLAIEWADKLPEPPPDAIRVTIEHIEENERLVRVEMPTAFPRCHSDR